WEKLKGYLERDPDPELQQVGKSLAEKQEHAAEEMTKEQGFQALEKRNISAAESDVEKVLERSPSDANAVAGLAFVRLNQKRFDEAVTLFARARSFAPKRADLREGYETAKFWSFMQQGSSSIQHNQLEPAITAYQEALRLRPADAQAHLGLGEAEVREKRLPDAEAEFVQALNLSPNNSDAIAGMAFIRLEQKKFDDAVELFDKARRLAPARADVEQGYRDAKYWWLMQQGSTALNQNRTAE